MDNWFFLYCRDGRIKVIGGDNIEGLLICPKKVPYKYLEVVTLGNVLLFLPGLVELSSV